MTRRRSERGAQQSSPWQMKGWGASAAAELRKAGSGSEGGQQLSAHSWVTFCWISSPLQSTTTCHLPKESWNPGYCAGIEPRARRRVSFSRIWSPSVMWLCPGPCGSCRTWPNMPAPYSRSWKTTWRPPTSGSGVCRGKLHTSSSAAPSWTLNRRQCVSTPLHTPRARLAPSSRAAPSPRTRTHHLNNF